MANEQTFWKYLKLGMGTRWHAQRHEDKHSSGIPDVSYGILVTGRLERGVNGWIELKTIPFWPVRPETIVRVDHYTQEQRIWLKQRGETGGRCFLFLKVKGQGLWSSQSKTVEYLLFNYEDAQRIGKDLTQTLMKIHALQIWKRKVNWDELREILCRQ
jgi:hypothetical protein